MRVAILVSGRGSNMERLAAHAPKAQVEIALVAADRPCVALERARAGALATRLVDRDEAKDRQALESGLAGEIEAAGADWILLAGYMSVLSGEFVKRFDGRILNIHPSLLPRLKGLNTHARAVAQGAHRHGATVHLVNAKLDDGPTVLQAALDVNRGDDADSLGRRVLQLEHLLYPFVMLALASGNLEIGHGATTWNDGRALMEGLGPPFSTDLAKAVIFPDDAWARRRRI